MEFRLGNKCVRVSITKRLASSFLFLLIWGIIYYCLYTFTNPPEHMNIAEEWQIILYNILTSLLLMVSAFVAIVMAGFVVAVVFVSIWHSGAWLFEGVFSACKDSKNIN